MKAIILTLALLTGISFGIEMTSESPHDNDQVFNFDELEKRRNSKSRPYLQFLDKKSLHCGIYSLDVGEQDRQQPHDEDEIYYIQEGQAKINISGQDFPLRPGSIVFVPAKAKHHFHSIEQDLKTLVFFSKGPVK